MESDCYSCKSNMGEVLIARNEERPARWDLWISGKLVGPAHYKSPDDAAFFASRGDFGDEEFNEKNNGFVFPTICDNGVCANFPGRSV